MRFDRKQPCNDCPYRKDAPKKLWAIEEYIDLINADHSQWGSVYGCHKKDDHVCVGWLMDQDKRGFPSIALRLKMSKMHVNRKYLDALKSPSEMFMSIKEMAYANYPKLKRLFK